MPTGYIYPKAQRPVRDMLRRRLLLVKQRTAQLLSLQSQINRHTGQRLSAYQIKHLTQDKLATYFDDSFTESMAHHTLLLMAQLTQQIEDIENQVLKHCKSHPAYSLLNSVPGIGKILGMTILLETGPIERFAQVGQYASYARCVPSNKLSNGKSKGKGNTKNGNRYLAMAFMEAAHYATIWNDTIKCYYQRRCKKVPVMVAKKTIANKLARACYHMLMNQVLFDIKRAFG